MLQQELKRQGDFLFRYRSYLPLIILVIGLAVFIESNINSIVNGHKFSPGYYMYICLAVSVLGQIIRIITVGYTPANTSGRNRDEQIADKINTSGIYSTVRHPLYLGNFLIWLGPAMLTNNLWFIISFILLFWVYYERIMYAEEIFLYKKFDNYYKTWAEKTKAFIPSFKNYKKNDFPFSWKKILKNEKNGIAAIFIVFFIFDHTGRWVNLGKLTIVPNFWFYSAIFSTVFYFILKIIKRRTTILDEVGR